MYTLTYSLALGPAYAATSDLRAQLVDTAGLNVGGAISSGFVNIGSGYHMWTYASIPDGHRGGVKFYSAAASGVVLGFLSINPQEAEYSDVKTSSVQTAITSAIAALNNLSSSDILDLSIESGHDLLTVLRVLYAAVAGKSTTDNVTTPTWFEYFAPDGTTLRLRHEIDGTTRERA